MSRLLVFGLAALALAGCSSTPDPNPAPVRLDDLNLTPYLDKACSLFDADQLADLGVAQATSDQSTNAGCVLTPKDRSVPDIVFALQTGQAAPKSTGMKIAGYPAQEQHTGVYCTVRVVVAPSQQIMANARGENDCHLAESVATTAIASIKRLSP
ncbi:DUF3558 family protein [Kutzneria sp. CA-103260]|uniref:DUF3558 family protein n=1 Tax=Kutzneria sp. CA-103260 TaxID=2802641 RepID=UPI001BA4EE80|nr:DUF3558 family protein [Kutzneria sp. CA-103260]